MSQSSSASHPFVEAPHKTFLILSIPTLFSLIAEPLTGLIDTAFIAKLGAEALAALGVGTMTLSSIFWVFNFLSIGTQTEVAKAFGKDDTERAKEIVGMGLTMAGVLGIVVAIIVYPLTGTIADAMGAEGLVHAYSQTYIQIRLAGGPAILVTLVAFGALRGLQDMQSPLWVALAINAINILLDAILIFGLGFIPAFGIAGAAWASVCGQWFGAGWVLWKVHRRLGFPAVLNKSDIQKLLVIGGDLFVRTGMLTFFLILTTRAATKMGADAGAAHQAIRQIWMFSALLLDAFAITGQSLVGYFLGASAMDRARKVAIVTCMWSFGSGILLAGAMWLGESAVIQLLVPATAISIFSSAWLISAVIQPINALTFATDGIHWGTGDFRFLRNAIITATLTGSILLSFVDLSSENALALIWLITNVWIVVRAVLGITRIWPGFGTSPWRRTLQSSQPF